MATTIPKNLFDYLVHEQITAGRYTSRQIARVLSLLNKADKEVLAKIAARGADGTFTARRLAALFKELGQMEYDAYFEAGRQLSQEMNGFAEHTAETALTMLAAQLPKRFSFVGISGTQLAAIIDTTPISIGPDKKLLLEEIFKSLAAGKEESIRGALRLGMVEGETVAQMVRRLQGSRASRFTDGIFEKHRKAAEGIVRTVVQHTMNQAVDATYKANSNVLNGWIDVATLDSRTCSFCWSKSGKKYEMGENGPPWHINCRCFRAPWIKSWKELGIDLEEMPASTRASKNGQVDSNISFNEWLSTQDKGTQKELLGARRQQLFAEGGLKLDKFTDASGSLYTLDDLKRKHAEAFKKAFGN